MLISAGFKKIHIFSENWSVFFSWKTQISNILRNLAHLVALYSKFDTFSNFFWKLYLLEKNTSIFLKHQIFKRFGDSYLFGCIVVQICYLCLFFKKKSLFRKKPSIFLRKTRNFSMFWEILLVKFHPTTKIYLRRFLEKSIFLSKNLYILLNGTKFWTFWENLLIQSHCTANLLPLAIFL